MFFLRNYLEEFFQVRKLSSNSKKCYEQDLEKFLRVFLKLNTEALSKLKPEEVLKSFSHFPERSKQRLCTNLRKYFLWLKDFKSLKIDPAWNQSWKFSNYQKTRSKQKIIEIPSESEINLILSFKTQVSLLKRTLIALIISTGASLEELSNLSWSDLNLETKKAKSSYLILGSARKKRLIPLEKKVLDILWEYKKSCLGIEKSFGYLLQFQEQEKRKTQNKSKIPAVYFSIWVLKLSKKFLNKNYSARNYQLYAREKLLKEKGLKISQKYLAKRTKSSLIQADKIQKITSKELKELKELHKRAFS